MIVPILLMFLGGVCAIRECMFCIERGSWSLGVLFYVMGTALIAGGVVGSIGLAIQG